MVVRWDTMRRLFFVRSKAQKAHTSAQLTALNLNDVHKIKDKKLSYHRGPRDASCQLKSCQLPRNSAETICTTSPEQIEVMKLEG